MRKREKGTKRVKGRMKERHIMTDREREKRETIRKRERVFE
jgi:hypothetical protein